MGRIAIKLLGPFEVFLDGEPVTSFESDKVRALLAYLASEAGQSHRRELLAGFLWPERPDRAARANLRHVLANLRKTINDYQADPPLLLITRQTIQFNFDSQAQIDIQTFTKLLETGTGQTISQLEEAVDLYRGDFLKGFSLDDSIAFEEWALLKREKISRKMVGLLETLSHHYERSGDVERAIAHARWQAALEPWDETTHQYLMTLFAQSGQKAAALRQYEVCKRSLAKELDIEPAAKTIRLYEQIRDRSIRPPASLPSQTTPFVGRKTELAALGDLLINPEVRLVTIVGLGGMGKTRLALAYAEQFVGSIHQPTQQTHYPQGVFFVDLAPLPDAERLILSLAQTLNLPIQAGTREKRSPKQQLLDYLSNKRLLLVLDNFEHMLSPSHLPEDAIEVDGADLLAEILQAAPEVRILITSRERLNLLAEQVFAIDGLDFPDEETIAPEAGAQDVVGYTAVQLFLQTAQRSQYNFYLKTDDDRLALARICQLVGGMPLALEMAASRVDTLSLVDIATEIQQNLDFLNTKMRDVPPRQRSIRATFDASWRELDEREHAIFVQLSIFRGGFSRSAVQAITGATSRQLSRLVNKSFIQFNQQCNRYQVHELLRQYGAERMGRYAELEMALQDRHSSYYCQLLANHTYDLKGAGQAQALSTIEADIENIRLAWNHAVANQDLNAISISVEALWRFYWNNGWLTQGLGEFEKALKSLRTGEESEEKEIVIGGILAGLGWLVRERPEKVWQIAEETQTLLQKHGSREETLMPLVSLAIALRSLELHEEAEQQRRIGLALAREIGDEWAIACLLQEMGHATRFAGEYERSEEYWQEALKLFRKNGDKGGDTWTLARLSVLAVDRGQYEKALALARESRLAAQEFDFKIITFKCLGVALHALSRYQEAKVQFQQSLAQQEELNLGSWAPEQVYRLGKVAHQMGDYACAHQQFQESLAQSHKFDIPVLVVKNHNALGRVCIVQGDNAQAKEHLRAALKVIVYLDRPPILLACLITVAELFAEEEKLEYAAILAMFITNHPASQFRIKERATILLIRLEAQLPADDLAKVRQASRQSDLKILAAQVMVDLGTPVLHCPISQPPSADSLRSA